MRTWIFVLLSTLFFTTALQARDPKEDQRIEFLIQTVETVPGMVFIRNGSEYDGKKAGEHLRMKLGKGGERVKTAEDFIEGIASKSSMSGKAYQIRSADGKTEDAGPFLLARLKEYDRLHTQKR